MRYLLVLVLVAGLLGACGATDQAGGEPKPTASSVVPPTPPPTPNPYPTTAELCAPGGLWANLGGYHCRTPTPTPTSPPNSKSEEEIYVVVVGDTLFGIAQKLDVSVKDLSDLNEIKDVSQLFVGTRLRIPERRFTPTTTRASP